MAGPSVLLEGDGRFPGASPPSAPDALAVLFSFYLASFSSDVPPSHLCEEQIGDEE